MQRPTRRRLQTGLSLVELMVGIALGLFVVAMALITATGHVDDNRRLLLETQVQQDLRHASDVLARDLRRAGYWASAESGVWTADRAGIVSNPYAGLSGVVANGPASERVLFSYSLDADQALPENNQVDDHDRAGFRLRDGALDLQLGAGNWQQLTDPAVLRITALHIELQSWRVDLGAACLLPCEAACPWQDLRQFRIHLEGEAAHDPRVVRKLDTVVRVPNDVVNGSCPA